MLHGLSTSGSALSESVSPVSARLQSADRAQVTGQHHRRGPLLLAQREGQRADAFVLVVVGVAERVEPTPFDEPKKDEKWPDT